MTRIVLLVLLFIGFARPQELGRIFVYAQWEAPVRSWNPIFCDGVVVAKIKRGTFFALNVTPGRHLLARKNGAPTIVNMKAGTEMFVRLDQQVRVGEPTVQVLDTVPQVVAPKEMRFLVYIDAKQVLSPSVSKADPRPPKEMHLKRRDESP
jgi:hypothetical protein